MKKTLAALAVLGAFMGSAVAADVTLYGDVDTGFKYTYSKTDGEGSTNTLEMANGINSSSKFGLMGTEELGNGVKVGFKLENGFNSDDGTFNNDGRLFGREASLSVYSDFGTVSLGRMGGVGSSAGTYDIVYAIGDSFDGGDEFALGFQQSSRYDYDNMITYQTPQFAGLQATVQYSFKNDNKKEDGDEGRSTADRYASFALTGEYGPVQFVGAYELLKYSTLDRATTADKDDGQIYSLGGNVDLGVAKLFAMGQYYEGLDGNVTDDSVAQVANGKKGAEGYGFHLGTIVPVAGGELTVGAYYTDFENGLDSKDDGNYYAGAARYCYPLSERTTVYVGAGYSETKVLGVKTKEGGAYAGIAHHF